MLFKKKEMIENPSFLKKKEMKNSKEEKIKYECLLYGKQEPSMDKIVERIFVGNYANALEKQYLIDNHIKFILTAADEMLCTYAEELNITYIRLPIKDSKFTDIKSFSMSLIILLMKL